MPETTYMKKYTENLKKEYLDGDYYEIIFLFLHKTCVVCLIRSASTRCFYYQPTNNIQFYGENYP